MTAQRSASRRRLETAADRWSPFAGLATVLLSLVVITTTGPVRWVALALATVLVVLPVVDLVGRLGQLRSD